MYCPFSRFGIVTIAQFYVHIFVTFVNTSLPDYAIIIYVNPPIHYIIFANPIVKIPSPKRQPFDRLSLFFCLPSPLPSSRALNYSTMLSILAREQLQGIFVANAYPIRGRWGATDLEKGSGNLFPVAPTDEPLQGEETLNPWVQGTPSHCKKIKSRGICLSSLFSAMRKMGLEPTRLYRHKILSLACLPIPALPHVTRD